MVADSADSVPAATSPCTALGPAAMPQPLHRGCPEQGKTEKWECGRGTDPGPRTLEEKSRSCCQGRTAGTPSSVSAWEQERAAAPAAGRSRQQCRQGDRLSCAACYQRFQQPSGYVFSPPWQQESGILESESLAGSLGSVEKVNPWMLVCGSEAAKLAAQHLRGHNGHILTQDPDTSSATGLPRPCTWSAYAHGSPGMGMSPCGRALPSPCRPGRR